MLFNSLEFLIFLIVVLIVYNVVPSKRRWIVLLLASYYFYMSWNPAFIILIITSTLIDYWAGLKIHSSKKHKKKFLVISLSSNLSLLFFFKYFNFFVGSISDITSIIGYNLIFNPWNIILPVGISFYTFQTLSYSIDIYKGKLEPITHIGKFALFVTFFPQLVAGPIERAKNLIPQVLNLGKITKEKIEIAFAQISWGFFLKIVVADNFSLIVDQAYMNYENLSGFRLIIPIILFSFQIYADFAGYSLIALGLAKFFGIDLMINFKSPYTSSTLTEFWGRWHISLSSWFKDYLYFPLGGNRGGRFKAGKNLLIVFLVSGLWHGAAFTFLIWGLIHAIIIIIEKQITLPAPKNSFFKRISLIIRNIFIFTIVTIAWVFFRAQDFEQAISILKRSTIDLKNQLRDIAWMFKSFISGNNDVNLYYFSRWFEKDFPTNALPSIEFLFITILGAILLVNYYDYRFKTKDISIWFMNKSSWFRVYFVSIVWAVIVVFGQFTSENQFIYFQF